MSSNEPVQITRFNIEVIDHREDIQRSPEGAWVLFDDVELILDAIPRLMSNWPPSRDGMDNEILPTGVLAMRAALSKVTAA